MGRFLQGLHFGLKSNHLVRMSPAHLTPPSKLTSTGDITLTSIKNKDINNHVCISAVCLAMCKP
jgi:hypothetical protein